MGLKVASVSFFPFEKFETKILKTEIPSSLTNKKFIEFPVEPTQTHWPLYVHHSKNEPNRMLNFLNKLSMIPN